MFDILGMVVTMGDLIWGKKDINSPNNIYIPEEDRIISGEEKKFPITEIKPIKFIYRPDTLEKYIGQIQAKKLVRMAFNVIINKKPLHFLITGNAGCGKTTLAQIIKNNLDYGFYSYIGNSFTKDTLKDFLIKNENSIRPSILFLDEIHSADKEILEFMLPIIEDYKLNGIDIKPFILVGATNEKAVLLRKSKPFCDRIQIQIQLEDYNAEEIKIILKQYNNQIYREDIPEEVYDILSINTRFNPRISIAYLDLYIGCKNIQMVLEAHRVIKDGITDIDLKILNHLNSTGGKPIGEQALSVIANVERIDYIELIEPYLLRKNLISRTSRGRILTGQGKLFLQEIKEEI
jgi:Holliday junction DNA helicase RuvB